MNRVILGLDKFWKNVDIPVGIFVSEIFKQPIANCPMRTYDHAKFNVGIPIHLKMDALAFQHLSEVSIYDFFALVRSYPDGTTAASVTRVLEYRCEC